MNISIPILLNPTAKDHAASHLLRQIFNMLTGYDFIVQSVCMDFMAK